MAAVSELSTIDHGHRRIGARLRELRYRLVLWIVVAEGVLVLLGVIPWWVVLAAAAVSVALYVWRLREVRSSTIREGAWIAAVSQLTVVLIPVFAFVFTALAVGALVVLALVALALLLLDRR